MASAERDVVREYMETTTITLTLDETEAETLAAILGKVGGEERRSCRKHASSILRALESRGVQWFGRSIIHSLSGNLKFAEGEA